MTGNKGFKSVSDFAMNLCCEYSSYANRDEYAYANFVNFIVDNEKARRGFKAITGNDVSLIPKGNVISEQEKYVIYQFLAWATNEFWDLSVQYKDVRLYKEIIKRINQ